MSRPRRRTPGGEELPRLTDSPDSDWLADGLDDEVRAVMAAPYSDEAAEWLREMGGSMGHFQLGRDTWGSTHADTVLGEIAGTARREAWADYRRRYRMPPPPPGPQPVIGVDIVPVRPALD